MVILRQSYALLPSLFFLLPLSCGQKTAYVPDASRQAEIVQRLPIAGPWGPVRNDLRGRLLLDRDSAMETGDLLAAVAIENVGTRPVELSSSGPSPLSAQIQWRMGGQPLPVDAPPPVPAESVTLSLAPRQIFVTDPAVLVIPPGPGLRQIDAQVTLANTPLLAPAMPLSVAPANWGQPTDGARLHLASARPVYTSGEPIHLRASIQNVGHDTLAIHPPDWSTLDIDTPRERLILQVKSADDRYADIPRNQAWWSPIPNLPPLAPGKYKLRLEITAAELPLPARAAWHGRLVSNELTIEVAAK